MSGFGRHIDIIERRTQRRVIAMYYFCIFKLYLSSSLFDICDELVWGAGQHHLILDLQEQSFFRPNLFIRVVIHLLNIKHLSCSLHKRQISPSPSFEAEIAHGAGADNVFERVLQQRKRRFKVHTVSCKDDIRVLR